MLQHDGVETAVMMVLVVELMMMMIPMKSSSMTMMMATTSHLREGISPADVCLPESFSLCVVFRPVAAVEYFSVQSPDVRVLWGMKYARGDVRGGPGAPYHA
jgi:hypothetical protein